jgi:hypothetical protein
MCLVFPADKLGRFTEVGERYIEVLHSKGLQTLAYQGLQPNLIFVLVKASIEVLRNHADDIDFPLLLDPNELKRILAAGNSEHGIAPIEITHMPEVSQYLPNSYIYGKYSLRMSDCLYRHSANEKSPFSSTNRVKLTAQLMEKTSVNGENLRKATQDLDTLQGYFALHDPHALAALQAAWLKYPVTPWKQPFDQITEYFGEKISMYFIFLGHYSWWCLFAAVVGVPMQIAVFVLDQYSAPFLPFFAYFIALWGILMLEFWKRQESDWAMKWGTLGCEMMEPDRANFEGVSIKSYVNGKDMIYFSREKQNRFIQQSILSVFAFVAMVVGAIASIYVIRFTIQPIVGPYAQTIASGINSVQIQGASMLYYALAVSLNDRENHRTETLYEDSLIAKIFLFEFVNNYSSFFYLAFFAEVMNDCPPDDQGGCMVPLAVNLAVIFISRLVVGNVVEWTMPFIKYQVRFRRMTAFLNSQGVDQEIVKTLVTRPEAEFILEPYDSHSASISDFTELAVQFGFASMFACALPISPLLLLVSNYVETTGDAWKLLHVHQRPQPCSCEDIGTWQTVFTIISVVSVIANSSLTVFTMTVTDHLPNFTRFWLYIGFQWTCFLTQTAIMYIVPDVSEAVRIQQRRTEFIVDKIIDQTPDDCIVRPAQSHNTADNIQPNPLSSSSWLRSLSSTNQPRATASTVPSYQKSLDRGWESNLEMPELPKPVSTSGDLTWQLS